MKNLVVSAAVLAKLSDKHKVSLREVEQCFENKCGTYLIDEREDHQTDPPTLWFTAATSRDRLLKVVFMFINGNIHIKTAYEAEQESIDLYDRLGK